MYPLAPCWNVAVRDPAPHAPVLRLQVWSTGQLSVLAQLPPEQASLVHATPSEQTFVSSAVYVHPVAGLQLSSVHGLLSLHVIGV